MSKPKNSTYARLCPFNEGILCESQKCQTCGWNPEVDRERREKMRQMPLQEEND